MNSSISSINATYLIQEEVSLAFLTTKAIAKLASFRAELNMRNLKEAQRMLDEHLQLKTQINQLQTKIASQAKFDDKLFDSATLSSLS
ncbi:MAG: hypothetical protein V4714_01800 [Bacteroidota bacterium]